jgi:holo-[acyl-carrier protein] synthase
MASAEMAMVVEQESRRAGGRIPMGTGTAIRVGTDVTAVHQVAESVRRFGVRYLERIYTEHEIGSCVGEPLVEAASLAARFAAKEATIKVLRPVGHQPDWRSVEVRRDPGGWCTMALTGRAAALADQAGITDLAVSLTHEGDLAAAVVVALCRSETESTEQPATSLAPEERGREN